MKIQMARAAVVAAMTALLLPLAAGPAAAEGEPWQKNSSWATVRVGTVKALQQGAPGGNVGWGVSYRRMLTPRLSVAGAMDHDLLGRFAGASLIEVPLSVEFLAHFRWKTPVHPAIGLGFAGVYRKAYRSGGDFSEFQPAGFFTVALHSPVSPHTLLGVEYRAMSVSSDQIGENPSFGDHVPSSGRSSFKVSVSRAYW